MNPLKLPMTSDEPGELLGKVSGVTNWLLQVSEPPKHLPLTQLALSWLATAGTSCLSGLLKDRLRNRDLVEISTWAGPVQGHEGEMKEIGAPGQWQTGDAIQGLLPLG